MATTAKQRTLRLAVAGSGAMARYHVRRFRDFPTVAIVGCYDRKMERARDFCVKHGIEHAADSVDALLESARPDALTVATADAEQAIIVDAGLRHGIPIFAEKPFTTDAESAAALAAVQQEAAVPLLVNFSKLNFPAVFGLLSLVDSGRLGTIRSVELAYLQSWLVSGDWGAWWEQPRWMWRISSNCGGGGALRDLGSHLFYLLIRLAGVPKGVDGKSEITASRSAAAGSGFSCDLNDSFTSELELSNGGSAQVRACYAEPGYTNCIYAGVTGERGSAELESEQDKNSFRFTILSDGRPRLYRFSKVYSTYAAFVEGLLNRKRFDAASFQPDASDALAVHRIMAQIT